MHHRIGSAALAALALVFVSCSEGGPTGPAPLAAPAEAFASATGLPPNVRIAELHYDDEGTDAGEKIEISGPANTSLKGWKVVLYNGISTSRAPYSTVTIGDVTIQGSCGSRGVHVVSYGVNGIQNGGSGTTSTAEPDGIALVDPSNAVVEFLSYEGTFTAAGTAPTAASPAAGMTSVDIGVRENGEPDGQSLKRDANGAWSGPDAHSFETCNDAPDREEEPVEIAKVTIAPAAHTMAVGTSHQFGVSAFDASDAPIAGGAIGWRSLDETIASVSATGLVTGVLPGAARIVATAPNGVADTAEVTVEPPPGLADIRFTEIHYDNASFDQNEAIEIEGPADASVAGWTVVLYNGNGGAAYHTRTLPATIPRTCEGVARGVVVLHYPADSVQNGPDGFALVDAAGAVIEFLSYEGVVTATDGPAAGMVSTDIGVAETSTTSDRQSLKRNEAGVWAAPQNATDVATFGRCNRDGPVPPAPTVTITGRGSSDPALPAGFEDQLFATRRDANGVFTPTTFIWSVDTPDLARVENGHVRALGAGTAIIRATAADGTTGTFSLRTTAATPSATARYQPHAEFGEPADGDASDDHLVRLSSYTASYNPGRGTANWVSYNLEASHFGPAQRCDCFTHDASFPASFNRLTTAEYTNSSDFHKFDIDRGHLVRSADRDAGVYDNASTFFFTNIIPQARENNQGPWGDLEDHLAALAQTRELFIIAGAAGSRGTLKDQGRITIPAVTWKVAVVLPADRGLADVRSLADLEVLAVSMPNDASVKDRAWREYETSVDAIEATSGYDLLAMLPDQVEIAVESRTRPPVAVANGPYAGSEGASVTLSAAGSTDPDGDALEYAWSFGDGASANGASVSHTWAQDGDFTVTLTVTDARGLTSTVETSARVSNVPPAIAAFAEATLLPGERYSAFGTVADPGADALAATVDFGDGSGVQPLALDGGSFALSHTYAAAGAYTVTVHVSDDDATATRTGTVTVLTPAQGVSAASALVDALGGSLNAGERNALRAKLSAALRGLGADAGTIELTSAAGTPASVTEDVSSSVVNQLGALLSQLDAMTQSRRLTAAQAAPLQAMVARVIASLE